MAGVLVLYRQLHPDDPALDAANARSAWAAMLGSGSVAVILAEVAGQLVATCTLAVISNLSRGARPYGVVENVVTHSEHRGRGLGRAVLRAALDTAWTRGCYKVMLATGSQQEATLRFYEGAGFRRGAKTHFEARSM